jgi:hypothetical protein
MSTAISTDARRRTRRRLRLVQGGYRPRFAEPVEDSGGGAHSPPPASVLVAGADASRRASMLGELRGLLPDGTPFVEARETWQALARAPESRMVVLTGDLEDISAQGLMRVLSRRHPLLPVIALGDGRRAAAPERVGVASL